MGNSLPPEATGNLRFLVVEVESQVSNLGAYFKTPSASLARRVADRGGYADNLQLRIQNSCASELARGTVTESGQLALHSLAVIAAQLERISACCRDVLEQLAELECVENVYPMAFASMLGKVRRGVRDVESAVLGRDTQLALAVGRIDQKLERAYARLRNDLTVRLKKGGATDELVQAMFAAYTVKQMGTALLRASESVISANLGQAINFERFRTLQAVTDDLPGVESLRVAKVAETRSGSAIAGLADSRADGDDYLAIYKDGQRAKLKEEKQGVKSWHAIFPGLAPRILSYKKRGESASLLIEHLPGLTFDKLLLNESDTAVNDGLRQLGKTLRTVWSETRTERGVNAAFMRQLERRLPDVYKIHPEFDLGTSRICGLEVPGFRDLVQRAGRRERKLGAPFSVYIHGDFNVDNIIFDPLERRINFIDLHRSRYMDYVQDVSVFMVSNYRLQILDTPLRQRLMGASLDLYRMAARFAGKQGDSTFEWRLALGLARSFATSTRFILDKSMARRMLLRSRYLLELALGVDRGAEAEFRIPLKEIFVD
ncbi:aminoglycoside phosphotransferase family protein [Parahaliea mediterranea]|uniref:Phosphotransferase n=1 Tax=Parahaliea mediterranea TaxID=651086 RepID=A0A939DGC6_9GAMM|nr:aminoglycoside phosphotransferase family protein [Parahaliea mediterranea]MBN7797559.1 phosphotransferase [Parahaliea mediterranea]